MANYYVSLSSSRRSSSSRRPFPGKLLRKLQLAAAYYLRTQLGDWERRRSENAVVEYQANCLIPTIIRWWKHGATLCDLAEMCEDEARSYYNDGRGLQAYIWDYAYHILIDSPYERADNWQEEHQFIRRYSLALRWVKNAEDAPWRTEDFKAAIKEVALESWSSSFASWDGVPYQYDNGPWPKEDRFYKLQDGSVLGVNWDGPHDTVRLSALTPRLMRNEQGKLKVW